MRIPRLSVRTFMGLIALVALLLGIWEHYFNPTRRWLRTIRDDDIAGVRRWEAVGQALGGKVPGIDDAAAVAALNAALDDPSFRVRDNAVMALGRFGPRAKAAVPALIAFVNEPEEASGRFLFPRILSAQLLHRLGETELALRILRRAAKDEDKYVQKYARGLILGINPDEAPEVE